MLTKILQSKKIRLKYRPHIDQGALQPAKPLAVPEQETPLLIVKHRVQDPFFPKEVFADEKGFASAVERFNPPFIAVTTEDSVSRSSLQAAENLAERTQRPLVMFDAVIHEYQIIQARQLGASGLVLMPCVLSEGQLQDYEGLAAEWGLTVFRLILEEADLGQSFDPKAHLILDMHLEAEKRCRISWMQNVLMAKAVGQSLWMGADLAWFSGFLGRKPNPEHALAFDESPEFLMDPSWTGVFLDARGELSPLAYWKEVQYKMENPAKDPSEASGLILPFGMDIPIIGEDPNTNHKRS